MKTYHEPKVGKCPTENAMATNRHTNLFFFGLYAWEIQKYNNIQSVPIFEKLSRASYIKNRTFYIAKYITMNIIIFYLKREKNFNLIL